jgi:alkanesulfonate monooxygenase SsuD/methylene tetrahydromethanopterin reductase-like flavin-dependent oxidoreductase (luciferase family)
MEYPVRVAEAAAVLDLIRNGRLEFGKALSRGRL